MLNFSDFPYARLMMRVEQALHGFHNDPDGCRSANVFGEDIVAEFATATNMSDEAYDALLIQVWGWLQRAATGSINKKTGMRKRTVPGPDRKKLLEFFLYKNGLVLASDWLPHLVSMPDAVAFAEEHDIRPHASQPIIGGRIYGDAFCQVITENRAELVILQWVHIDRERFIRVRRFTLIIERQPFESNADFSNRLKRLDTDYGMMEDELGNLGSDWGEVWVPQKGAPPTTISGYKWQFERKNRILAFTETDHNGNARNFEFVRRPDQIARMHAVQAKVDELERFQEAAE